MIFDPDLTIGRADPREVDEIVPVFRASLEYRAERMPGSIGARLASHLNEAELRTLLERAITDDSSVVMTARYPDRFGDGLILLGALLASRVEEARRVPDFVEAPMFTVDYLARSGADGYDKVPVRRALVGKLEEIAMREGIGVVELTVSERPKRHREPYRELGYEVIERRMVKLLH